MRDPQTLLEFANSVHQMAWTARSDGTFTKASDALAEFAGLDGDDLDLDGWLELIHADDHPTVKQVWAEALADPHTCSIDLRLRAANGEHRWHRITGRPIRDGDHVVGWYCSGVDMHDRRVAEDALRVGEARLRAILASEPECVKIVSSAGVLLDMNAAGLAMIEADDFAQVAGGTVVDLVHPDDRERYHTFHRLVLIEGTGEFVFRIIGLRGTQRWVESRAVALADAADELPSVLSVTRDISERIQRDRVREAEGRILEQLTGRAELDDVIEQIAAALAQISGSATSVSLVDQAAGRLRFIASSTLPAAYTAALDGLEIGPTAGSCGAAAASGQFVVVTDIDADPRWASLRELVRPYGLRSCWSTPVFGSSGEVVATLGQYYQEQRTPTTEDRAVSERFARLVSIAVDRIRADEELRASEERFRIVARATSDLVWDWDVVSGTVWRSGGLDRMLGEEDASLPADQESWQDLLHPDDRPRAMEGFDAALAGDAEVWSDEYRLLHRDGSVHHVRERASIIRDDSGQAIRVIGSSIDITRELELERQLAQSQRLESIGQLTGGIAHDFNNLLTVILGTSELLQQALGERADLRTLATTSRDAAIRGADLTARLLAFARRQPLDPSAIDVDGLLARLGTLLARTLGGHVDLSIKSGDGVWSALIDPGQLESAVLNLCINARDAMPQGGSLTIQTSNVCFDQPLDASGAEVQPGEYVVVSVSDTGCGMSPEVASRAFDPFFTTKPSGSGLGLSMVYGFAKQSMGHVTIDSRPSEGTTVRLYLPRAEQAEAPDAEPPEAEELAIGHETILLVEDDDLVRAHVATQLRLLGYQVLVAAHGAAALAVLEGTEAIDLLITDVVMPGGMNGRELAERSFALRPDLPVLFTSGYAEQVLVHDGRLDPGVLLLGKPYRLAELAAKVRLALQQRA